MSCPEPKPNNDGLISERLDIVEQLLHHMLRSKADETTKSLLRKLEDLKTQQGHLCSVCGKSYSDAKGLRRHILTTPDERHTTLAGQLKALVCRWCKQSTTDTGRKYTKREQVTKHENTCENRSAKRAWTTESEEEPETPLPPVVTNPDIMESA